MEIEQSHDGGDNHRPPPAEMTDGVAGEILTQRSRTTLLIINILVLAAGASGGPLMIRLYFLHGGGQKWFSAFLQTTAFPLMLLPVLLSSFGRPRSSPLLRITPPLLLASAVLGLLTGADNFLYSYGASYLPVSTSSLLLSTQLGFTALFAFFIVKQKFAAPSINAVVLLTIGAAVLGVRSSGDRPEGESKAKYYLGFTMMLGAAALYGLVLPVVELTYSKAKQAVSFTLVLEIQFVIAFFATLFCGVGMAVNREFQAIAKEAREYGLGETQYYLVVIFTALITQCFFLGAMGTVNYSSAMLAGIIIALSITITEVLGVFFFHEKFDGEKGVALALSLWGSASYFYGLSDYLYSYGMSFIPVSTSALLLSTQLGFTAGFAYLIVKQKFTATSINAVVLLTFGAAVLGVHASGDRPDGESKAKYYIGFLMTLGAAVVYGLVLPLVELLYKQVKQEVTYGMVMEIQFVIGFSATTFCAIGMFVKKDFEAISREAEVYKLGQANYYLVVIFAAIITQCFFLGMVGTIKYSSALLSGVVIAVCIPLTEVLAVFFFHEKFNGDKGVALALSLWGMASYFYGEYNDYKKNKTAIPMEVQLPISVVSET